MNTGQNRRDTGRQQRNAVLFPPDAPAIRAVNPNPHTRDTWTPPLAARGARYLILLLSVVGLFHCIPGTAQESAAGSTDEDQLPLAPRTDQAIVIDGRLDEEAWGQALVIDLPLETWPAENQPAPVATKMLMMYGENRLYVAFRAQDPEPHKIRARVLDRDQAFEDDLVGISLDPFNDQRRAFEFLVNPLGSQIDRLRDDVSDTTDRSWDAIWLSAGRVTGQGFEVELAIPFSSLRFPRTEGVQTWGFGAQRVYPRRDLFELRSEPVDRNLDCAVCQYSKVRGFAGVSPGRNIEITPAVTSIRTDQRQNAESGLVEGEVDTEPALTARWGITPGLNLSATVNPDFSQVEADIPQLAVNTRFALFFPEKRPFFQEGADFFTTPLRAVYTRTVGEPDWGLKLSGKEGPHAFGIFSARDASTGLLLPGSQRSRFRHLDMENTSSVVRYRRDLGQRSNLGFVATDRSGGDYFNRLAGVDGQLRVSASDTVRFQFLGSRTRYPSELAQEGLTPEGEIEDTALRVAFTHDSRNWNAYATYEDIGEDFRADLGFMPQVDRRFSLAGLERIWWGGEDDWWTNMGLGGDYNVTEDQSGIELEREAEAWYFLKGPLQSLLRLGYEQRTRHFNGRNFDETEGEVVFEIVPNGSAFLAFEIEFGDDIDFVNNQPGDRLSIEPFASLSLGKHLRARLSHIFERLDVDGGRLFTANLSEVRLVYQFNLRTLFRVVTQYFDLERDPTLYMDPVSRREDSLFNELLFSYKLNPRTLLFLGYSDNHGGDDRIDLTQQDRSVFLKISYAWVL